MAPDPNDLGDLEDDLLALAGEGASEAASPPNEDSIASPQPKASPSPNSDSKAALNAPQKGVARKMNKRTAASRPTLTVEPDEDEASSPARSPDSTGSRAMSESDEEDVASPAPAALAPPPVADGPRYALEGKFISQKDKQEIMSLPEARREQILSERAEEMERDTFNRQLRQRHEAQQQENSKDPESKKRPAAADLEQPAQKVKRTVASERLEAYKKQREQKNEQRQSNEKRRTNQDRSSHSSGREFSSSRSITPRLPHHQSPKTKVEDPRAGLPMDLQHAAAMQLTRGTIPNICFTPGFERIAVNCFIRIGTGPDPQTGTLNYKLCTVKEVVKGKRYSITSSNETLMETDSYFVARCGKWEKKLPFPDCSNGKCTTAEWDAYKDSITRENLQLLTIGQSRKKIEELIELKNHVWTNAELTEKLRRSGSTQYREDLYQFRIARTRRAAAEAQGDLEAIERENNIIAALEEKAGRIGQALAVEPKITEADERILKLNADIRRSNAVNNRKAQVMDRRKQREYEAAFARGEVELNRFARVKTMPQMFYDHKAKGSPKVSPPAPKNEPVKDGGEGDRKRQKKLNDEDVIASLDIDLDIDI